MDIINNYLNSEGLVKIWPSKRSVKIIILLYLVDNFEKNKIYNETQVNEIIKSKILFEDYVIIRRELIENNLMFRSDNCKEYWR